MYAERQARRRINQKKTREPAGVSARGLFCARIYAARRAQVAGCPRPRPPAPARARAYLPGPCVRRKSAPRRPHACAAARARHLSHCVHFTSLSARTPSSGPRAGGACVFYHMNGFMRFRRPLPFFFRGLAAVCPRRRRFLPPRLRSPRVRAAVALLPFGALCNARCKICCAPPPLLEARRARPRLPASDHLPGPCVRRKSAPAPARARAGRTPAGMSSLRVCPPLSAPPFRRASQSCAPGAPVSAQCRRAVITSRIYVYKKSMWPCAVKSR